jgi:hypothetical protein
MRDDRRVWLALLAVAVPLGAGAHSLSDEVSVAGTELTPRNPRTGNLSNLFTGMLDINDWLGARFDFSFTRDNPTPPTPGSPAFVTGANILTYSLGVDVALGENFFLSGAADLTPRTQQRSVVPFIDSATGQEVDAHAFLVTGSRLFGAAVNAGYGSAGSSNLEVNVDAALGFTRYSSNLDVQGIETPRGTFRAGQIVQYCQTASTRSAREMCRTLLPALARRSDTLNELRAGLGAFLTLWQDTDVGLSGAAYFYDKDPTEVGYFSVVALGRSVLAGSTLQIAPLQFTVRPSVTRRFGDLSLDLSYQYGRYVADEGSNHLIALKVSYRFNRSFKAWLRLSGQSDVAPELTPLRSASLGLGVRWTF